MTLPQFNLISTSKAFSITQGLQHAPALNPYRTPASLLHYPPDGYDQTPSTETFNEVTYPFKDFLLLPTLIKEKGRTQCLMNGLGN